ncbi:MAG: elongator complex protein 3 [Vulcanisaeta sp.]|uniref:elongator complex protein 3 n=1 Tax=Vulcanisaeta sp. TaxID=2020871 RepID=UPI003D124BEC
MNSLSNALLNRLKPTRTISGVVPIAIMVEPVACPFNCIYCPGGKKTNTPKSYLPDSPVVLRAAPLNYDPYKQVVARIRQYEALHHPVSKVELIIMGGTVTSLPESYLEWFVSNAFKAVNDYPFIGTESIDNTSIENEHKRNEKARIRVVALELETRPDFVKPKHIDIMLRLGFTRVEIGVQSIYDDVLKRVKRGHGVKEVIEATQYLKDSAYKVCYHIMPGLPGSTPDRDLEMVKTIFSDPSFMPDCIKVYPTFVVKDTELYEEWLKGLYRSYDEETWHWLLAHIMASIPRWVRVMRFGRDIPLHWVVDGPKIGNMREVVLKDMEELGLNCVEIRCREVGHKYIKKGLVPTPRRLMINRIDYEASSGHEVFLEATDDEDTLYGILRLRIPSANAHRPEIKVGRTALIRELHVYGPELPIGSKTTDLFWWQHRGIGRALMARAEHIALEEFNAYRMLVISGVGVREYYRMLGYRKYPGSFYMFKDLRKSILTEPNLNDQSSSNESLIMG